MALWTPHSKCPIAKLHPVSLDLIQFGLYEALKGGAVTGVLLDVIVWSFEGNYTWKSYFLGLGLCSTV